jgi:hypothetical protein
LKCDQASELFSDVRPDTSKERMALTCQQRSGANTPPPVAQQFDEHALTQSAHNAGNNRFESVVREA